MAKDIGAFAWIDIETTSLAAEGNGIIDFRDVHVLEFAMIVTDLDLDPIVGYTEVVKMTPEAALALRGNDFVREMHQKNGLIKDSIQKEDALTLEGLEAALIETLQKGTAFNRGEFMIAGSGVARFDFPLIKAKMPDLAKWFAYYEGDIGVLRRLQNMFARRYLINPVLESYADGVKTHRAWDDVQAHLKEGKRQMEFYRSLPETR